MYTQYNDFAECDLHLAQSLNCQRGNKEPQKLKSLQRAKKKTARRLKALAKRLEKVEDAIKSICPHLPEHNRIYLKPCNEGRLKRKCELWCSRCDTLLKVYRMPIDMTGNVVNA